MKKIIVWCQAGTGSTVLSKILNRCGMHFGNKHTYYRASAEHSLLTAICGNSESLRTLDVQLQQVPGSSSEEKMRKILQTYEQQAAGQGWNCFGVKITSGLTETNFYNVLRIFEEEWGKDIILFTTLRHPFGCLMRLDYKQRPQDKVKDIVNGFKGLEYGKAALAVLGAKIIPYPEGFDNQDGLAEAIQSVGLPWHPDAGKVYIPSNPTRLDEGQKKKFEEEHPDLARAYYMLREKSCQP